MQRAARAREPGPNRTDGHVQGLGNLAVLESFDVGQHDDQAVMLGQRGQRAIQILAQQLVEELLLGIGEPEQEGLVQALENRKRALFVAGLVNQQFFARPRQRLPPLADEGVVQNPEHPRPKRAGFRERLAGTPGARDGLGHEVLRIGLDTVIIPAVSPTATNLQTLLADLVDCQAVGSAINDALVDQFGFGGGAGTWATACTAGLVFGSQAVYSKIDGIDSSALEFGLVGVAKAVDTNGDSKADKLQTGKWTGTLSYANTPAPLSTATFIGARP